MTPKAARAAAFVLATLGAGASLLLVLGHWHELDLPGCRLASPCSRAAESPWAEAPLVGPVAGLALAFHAGWLFAVLLGPIPSGRALRWLTRAAFGATLLYLAIAFRLGLFCPYCFASHAATFGLWALAELARRGPKPRRSQWIAAPIAASAVLVAVGLWSGRMERERRLQEGEREGQAQIDLKEAFAHGAPAGPSLAGRFPLRTNRGTDPAPIEVVVFTGYQCPDCFKLEAILGEALARAPDASLTVRHFPFCADCNRLAKQTLHPNACWAARAAETAGILRGVEGFWAMHRWLFARRGAFTDAELAARLAEEKYDAPAFLALMQSDRTLTIVKDDVELAASLALNRTPTVFVNNVEVKLWNAPAAIPFAIEEARKALKKAVPAKPGSDSPVPPAPPTGADRLLAEWREQPVVKPALDLTPHTIGSTDAPVQIVVFGDYQDDGTVRLDARLRAIAAADPRVRYAYRHFPADQKCNPTLPKSFHPLACRLARTAEAAGAIGGEDAFWKVHTFILEHHQAYTDADLRDFCDQNSLGAGAILKARDDPRMTEAVSDDVQAGVGISVGELPWLLVNGRRAPRWTLDRGDVLELLVTEAAR